MLFIRMLISLEVKTHEISCPALLIPSGEIIPQITKSNIAYKMMGTSTRVIGQENFNDSLQSIYHIYMYIVQYIVLFEIAMTKYIY